jgi:Cu2+-exporting ATPase
VTVHQRDWQAFVVPADDGAVHMDLAVDGITCAACMGEIERGLKRLPGIRKARVNLTSQRLAVDWVEDQTGADEIVAELERLGYAAHPFDPASQKERQDKTGKQLLRCLAVSGFAGMNIMLLSVSVWSGNASDITPETRDFFHWLSALIALPTVAYFRPAVCQERVPCLVRRASQYGRADCYRCWFGRCAIGRTNHPASSPRLF